MKWTPARTAIVAIAGAALAGLAVAWLLYPAPIVSRPVEVPQLRGQASAQAIAALSAAGLRGRLAGELDDPLTPAGTVSWQSPVAGTTLPESAVVRLGISSGAPRVLVPDLANLDLNTAVEILVAAGLGLGRVDSLYASDTAGVVIRTVPEARQPIRAGSRVEITISRGPRNRP